MVRRFSLAVVLALLSLATLPVTRTRFSMSAVHAGEEKTIYVSHPQRFSHVHKGDTAASSGTLTPLSVVSADIDGDGALDLVTGYTTAKGGAIAIYRGSMDAIAPQGNEAVAAIGRQQYPSPFRKE